MNRRSFLLGFAAAPAVVPAAIAVAKQVAIEDFATGAAGQLVARPLSVESLSTITARMGTMPAGRLVSANGSISINFDRGVITIDELAALAAQLPPDQPTKDSEELATQADGIVTDDEPIEAGAGPVHMHMIG